jgi:hypothetical protein
MDITKKKDGKTRTATDNGFPADYTQLITRFTEDEVYALAKSALVIRLQAILAANMDKKDEEIQCLFRDFKPGQGHGGASRKQSLIASIMEADQLKIFTGELLKTMKIAQLEDILQRLTK